MPTKADLKQQPLEEGELHPFVISDAKSASEVSIQINCPQTIANLTVISQKMTEHFDKYNGGYNIRFGSVQICYGPYILYQ